MSMLELQLAVLAGVAAIAVGIVALLELPWRIRVRRARRDWWKP